MKRHSYCADYELLISPMRSSNHPGPRAQVSPLYPVPWHSCPHLAHCSIEVSFLTASHMHASSSVGLSHRPCGSRCPLLFLRHSSIPLARTLCHTFRHTLPPFSRRPSAYAYADSGFAATWKGGRWGGSWGSWRLVTFPGEVCHLRAMAVLCRWLACRRPCGGGGRRDGSHGHCLNNIALRLGLSQREGIRIDQKLSRGLRNRGWLAGQRGVVARHRRREVVHVHFLRRVK